MQWVELDVLSPESRLFLWCVYIPPGNTRYASESCFTEIENDIIHFSQKSKCGALVGDVNERTEKLSDFIIPDEHLLHHKLDITEMKWMNICVLPTF